MYSSHKINIWNIKYLICISNILYKCGKEMANRYDLHHWNNSRIKSLIIVLICAVKNRIYLVYDKNKPAATFQVKVKERSLFFEKLATLPEFEGKGIGTFCINEIERIAKDECCHEIICDVYDKSYHAQMFYKHKGYVVYGEAGTLKYKTLKFKKDLGA